MRTASFVAGRIPSVSVEAGTSARVVLPKALSGWSVHVAIPGALVKLGEVNAKGRTPSLSPPGPGRYSIVLRDGRKIRTIHLIVSDPTGVRSLLSWGAPRPEFAEVAGR